MYVFHTNQKKLKLFFLKKNKLLTPNNPKQSNRKQKMSSYNRTQSSYKTQQRVVIETKKFCKVCKDAGKSEMEYTSHFVRISRDENSKVVCPTLLAQKCRYCGQCGHTPKGCDILKQKEKDNQRHEEYAKRAKEYEMKQSSEFKKKFEKMRNSEMVKCGSFTSIMIASSSDEEEDDAAIERRKRREQSRRQPPKVLVPAPVLCVPVNFAVEDTYASRLKRIVQPKPEPKPEPEMTKITFLVKQMIEEKEKEEEEEKPVVVPTTMSNEKKQAFLEYRNKQLVNQTKKSWADDSSDDEDEDEDDDEEEEKITVLSSSLIIPDDEDDEEAPCPKCPTSTPTIIAEDDDEFEGSTAELMMPTTPELEQEEQQEEPEEPEEQKEPEEPEEPEEQKDEWNDIQIPTIIVADAKKPPSSVPVLKIVMNMDKMGWSDEE